MIDSFLFVLVLATALGCGLVAGSLFAFSSFVMKALVRVPDPQGIVAMQSINVTAVMPGFMSAFVGSAIASAALVVAAIFTWDESYGPYLLAGGVCYLVGTFGVTVGYHVPRNNALETIDPTQPDAVEHWRHYVSTWTTGNHVRVAAALGAATLFTLALRATWCGYRSLLLEHESVVVQQLPLEAHAVGAHARGEREPEVGAGEPAGREAELQQ
jgi:uncharacterized membrane protein